MTIYIYIILGMLYFCNKTLSGSVQNKYNCVVAWNLGFKKSSVTKNTLKNEFYVSKFVQQRTCYLSFQE